VSQRKAQSVAFSSSCFSFLLFLVRSRAVLDLDKDEVGALMQLRGRANAR
jgi:hypothetical protein